MAIMWADSFDHYGLTEADIYENFRKGAWNTAVGLGINVGFPTNARTGNFAFRTSAGAGYKGSALRTFPGAIDKNVIGVGAGVFLASMPNTPGQMGMAFRQNSNDVVASYTINTDGSLGVYLNGDYLGQSMQLVGSTEAGVIQPGAYQYIEFAVMADPLVGWIEIRVDGVTVYRIEELPIPRGPITHMRIGSLTNWVYSGVILWDDIVAWDDSGAHNNTFTGPVRVYTGMPNGDGTEQDWIVHGAATAWEAVSDIPPDGETTYIEAEDAGNVVELTLPDLPPEVVAISGVYIPIMGKLVEAGVGRVSAGLSDGTNAEMSPEQPLTPTYAYRGFPIQKNPTTGEPWTREEYNDAVLRIEKTV